MRGECLLKNTDHEHFNTFSIDENVSGHDSLKIKQYPNHDSLKLKFAIFENFTNHGESIRDIPQSQIMNKNDEREIRNACVAVKRGLRVRRNCNVFNLAMETMLKGLPDKIRDQLPRHHTQMHFKNTHFWITFKLRDPGDDVGFLYT